MSNVPGPPSQGSSEQPKVPDHQIEAAKAIFRKARANKENVRERRRLFSRGTSVEEKHKRFLPSFKELASVIAGTKVDVTPPGLNYFDTFQILLDQSRLELEQKLWRSENNDLEDSKDESGGEEEEEDAEKDPEDVAIRQLINYITTEVKKLDEMEAKQGSNVEYSVKEAWKTEYRGNADELLREAVFSMHRKSSRKPYANFCTIIQSSGTGKSRLVDKFAESVFTIPITLRPLEDTLGFPLGDAAHGTPLVEFFCHPGHCSSALHAQLSYLQFLLNTLAIADKWIDEYKKSGREIEDVAAAWREQLGAPRSAYRRHMYGEAIGKSVPEGFESVLNESTHFDLLQRHVNSFIEAIVEKIKPKADGEPLIVFYFDEAQHLTAFPVTKEGQMPRRTAYQCLCKAFIYMVDAPVFALFLSAYSRLSESAPTTRHFWSSRMASLETKESDDNLNAPFVELPFDVWKSSTIVTEGSHSGDEICSLRFMARFGRPLFWAMFEIPPTKESNIIKCAMSKLELRLDDSTRQQTSSYRHKPLIPLLAARIDFTFESNRDEAVLVQALLVASGGRMVYSIPQHRQYLRGGYPSEPFLAEAAARATFLYFHDTLSKAKQGDIAAIIAEYKDVVPEAVSGWSQQGLIDKGLRGELVTRVLCTLAHDIAILKKLTAWERVSEVSFSQMVPVVDFFRALIAKEHIDKVLDAENTSGKPLKEVFENAYVHFTQFVQAGDKSVMTDEAAYLFFTRGAAIQGYGTMPDVDFIIPVWIRGAGSPDRWSMTAIFIQVKNRIANESIQIDVQKPTSFFSGDDERPYISIVMQLGLSVEKDKVVTVSRPCLEKLRDQREHPRYEIFINGCSREAYNVIGEDSTTYSTLLAERNILSEHPRGGKFLTAVKRMKPFWVSGSYDWATMIRKDRPMDEEEEREDN